MPSGVYRGKRAWDLLGPLRRRVWRPIAPCPPSLNDQPRISPSTQHELLQVYALIYNGPAHYQGVGVTGLQATVRWDSSVCASTGLWMRYVHAPGRYVLAEWRSS